MTYTARWESRRDRAELEATAQAGWLGSSMVAAPQVMLCNRMLTTPVHNQTQPARQPAQAGGHPWKVSRPLTRKVHRQRAQVCSGEELQRVLAARLAGVHQLAGDAAAEPRLVGARQRSQVGGLEARGGSLRHLPHCLVHVQRLAAVLVEEAHKRGGQCLRGGVVVVVAGVSTCCRGRHEACKGRLRSGSLTCPTVIRAQCRLAEPPLRTCGSTIQLYALHSKGAQGHNVATAARVHKGRAASLYTPFLHSQLPNLVHSQLRNLVHSQLRGGQAHERHVAMLPSRGRQQLTL